MYQVQYAQNRTHIHGFLIHHVSPDGLLRLRFTSDAGHDHSADNRLIVDVCRAYDGWDFPAEWDVTISQCEYLPGLVGTHRLTMQEGYFWGPWVKASPSREAATSTWSSRACCGSFLRARRTSGPLRQRGIAFIVVGD